MRTIDADVLVVGGGLAALRSALAALQEGARVVVAVKGRVGRSGSSAMTSAGYSSVISPDDSPEKHFRDTIAGGRGINDPRLVRIMVEEAPARLRELVELGGRLAQRDGVPVVHPSGDHSVPRTVVAANFNGTDFTVPLARAVEAHGGRVLEHTAALDVDVVDGSVVGAVLLHLGSDADLVYARTPCVILGTGGAGNLFSVTSNPNDVTGDGYALALRAGAALRDMEFIQFYPWRCVVPFRHGRMPIQPSTFVLGGKLYNAEGRRFMLDYDADHGEATTRDVSARAIYDQIRAGKDVDGGVLLDVSDLTDEEWADSNPKPEAAFRSRKVYFRDVRMILAPEAHFFMGGVIVDEFGQSDVEGLYAVGETAGGVHGANRLDSNALPETQTFGARAGSAAARRALKASHGGTGHATRLQRAAERAWRAVEGRAGNRDPRLDEARTNLQSLTWGKLGIVRDERRLRDGLAEIAALRADLDPLAPCTPHDLQAKRTLENAYLVAETCFRAALTRRESRGAHYRLDFPERDDEHWLKVVTAALDPDGHVAIGERPLSGGEHHV